MKSTKEKYFVTYLRESECLELENAAKQYNLEYGTNCIDALPTKEVTKEEFDKFFQ